MLRRFWVVPVLVLLGMLSQVCLGAPEINDMRGDQGLLTDFDPTGVAWMPDGNLFVVDAHYNCFHIFDTHGRRFRFLEFPKDVMGICHYTGVARLNPSKSVYYPIGSHCHVKNDPRFLSARSVLHKVELTGETTTEESCKTNFDPDRAFRATGYYGDSVPKERRLEVSGLTFDPKHNRVFMGCDRPLAPDGTLLVFNGPLDKLLAVDKEFAWKELRTGIKPATNPAVGTQYYLSDMEYVPDKGLVLLLTSSSGEDDQLRFGSSQIWFLRGGFGPGKLLYKDIAPGNRATGISLKPTDKWHYAAAIVCDNQTEDTKVPSRLVILGGLQLPLK